jgi:hypothetical protein
MRKGCREQPEPREDVKISVLARQQEFKDPRLRGDDGKRRYRGLRAGIAQELRDPRLRGDDVLRSHFRCAEMTDSWIFEAVRQ